MGNYAGTVTKTFAIQPAALPEIGDIAAQTYSGEAIQPVAIEGLTEGTDYTVEYSNNTEAGTATATVTGMGNYAGTVTKTFVIQLAEESEPIAALAGIDYLVSDGYGLGRSYAAYEAENDALEGKIRLYRVRTADETIDWGDLSSDEILLRLACILHLRADRIAAFKAAGVQWIIFIADDAVLIIRLDALEAGVDYRFFLKPNSQLRENYRVYVTKDDVESEELPAGSMVGLVADDEEPISEILFSAEDGVVEQMETDCVELQLVDVQLLSEEKLTVYVVPAETQGDFCQADGIE